MQSAKLHLLYPRMAARLKGILTVSDFEFAELSAGGSMVGWGLWLLNPAVDTFSTSATFRAFAILPEWAWALAAIALGSWQVLALLTDNRRGRVVGSFAVAIGWTYIWFALVLGNWRSTATETYLWPAFSAAWSYWRLSVK
jgi:hypothetical protein